MVYYHSRSWPAKSLIVFPVCIRLHSKASSSISMEHYLQLMRPGPWGPLAEAEVQVRTVGSGIPQECKRSKSFNPVRRSINHCLVPSYCTSHQWKIPTKGSLKVPKFTNASIINTTDLGGTTLAICNLKCPSCCSLQMGRPNQ